MWIKAELLAQISPIWPDLIWWNKIWLFEDDFFFFYKLNKIQGQQAWTWSMQNNLLVNSLG